MKNITLFIILGGLIIGCNPRSKEDLDTSSTQQSEVKTVDPTWPMPEGAAVIELSKTEVSKEGDLIEGKVTLNRLTLLLDTMLPKGFNEAVPLVITVKVSDGEVAKFRDGLTSFEHTVNINNVGADGTYSFPVELIGYKPGNVSVLLSWKWPVATEGCCSIALLAILAGCNNNAACICTTMAAMPAPGSWCCSIHPLVFRYYWSFYKCAGPSPY
jgi:hypothetical protein